MSWYQIALLVHVLGSFGVCAALGLEWPVLFRLRQTRTVEEARGIFAVYATLKWLGRGSLVALLAGGFYMASVAWREAAWATAAFGAVILFALIGRLATGVRMARAAKALAGDDGLASRRALSRIRDRILVVSLLVRTAIVVSAAVLMVFKPDLGVSAAIVLLSIIISSFVGLVTTPKREADPEIADATPLL